MNEYITLYKNANCTRGLPLALEAKKITHTEYTTHTTNGKRLQCMLLRL